jgi:hypothetical protein
MSTEADLLVHSDSGELLADALKHDTAFAVIDREALFERYNDGVRGESSDDA